MNNNRLKWGKFERERVGQIHFAMPVYNSVDDVAKTLPELRQHYPHATIALIDDGDNNRKHYEKLAKDNDAYVTGGEHLFTLKHASQFLVRLLNSAPYAQQYFVRIDPDACVNHCLTSVPMFDCMFGTLEGRSSYYEDDIIGAPNVQGGCLGMTCCVVNDILNTLRLFPSILLNGRWARCRDTQEMFENGKFSDDFTLSWIANELGYPLVSHPEIRSNWIEVPNNNERFAITHPRVKKNSKAYI